MKPIALVAILLVAVTAQAQTPRRSAAERAAAPPSPAHAVRVSRPPVIDGRDDDLAWRDAPVIDRFRQFEPAEDAEPSERTEARVVYDERHLYVLVRAFDPHPDSIVRRLGRRDEDTNGDLVGVVIDAYRDRRTGVQLSVTAAGVKEDAAVYNDGETDTSWDGVWDAATQIDSLGWVAEFRIPFSQLRFSAAPTQRFGFSVWRELARRNEQMSAPLYRPSQETLASQLGELAGLEGLVPARRLELMPYAVAKSESERRERGWGRANALSLGADVKYGVTPTLTFDATINPDFGQVEADPAVLNLSAFETQFEERRPFFQEGVGLFRCGGPCEGVFYTRRIGRAPQLRRNERDPNATTILAAAKLTGRVGRGLSVGVVDALTQREVGADGRTIEPRTHYAVGRLYQELRGGRSGIGTMLTAVNRELDAVTDPILRRDAYTLLVQGFHRFANDRFELMAYAAENRVTGSMAAIARTQLGPVHFYQRPDHRERFDSTRTHLGGGIRAAQLRKLTGTTQFTSYVRYADPGAELNDLGFVSLVDDVRVTNQLAFRSQRPRWFFRRGALQLGVENHWTTDGLPTGMSLSTEADVQLPSGWEVEVEVGAFDIAATHCVTCARGGPALRVSPARFVDVGIDGDARGSVVPHLNAFAARTDGGRGSQLELSLRADVRIASRLSIRFGPEIEWNVDDDQWVANFGDRLADTTHFTFARLKQTTVSLLSRATFAVSPSLSVQLYAEPFVSAGAFTRWRELADPRASNHESRFRPFGDGSDPGGFNEKSFNSNVVARWEYRPGSAIFLVWQQGREQDDRDAGSFDVSRDYRNLFRSHPSNTFLVKVSWWFGA